jgi:hypothetical protein
VYVEVESNPNCEGSVFIRFRELGPARPVRKVRMYDRLSQGEWCTITGLDGEPPERLCPARAQPVEDSGAGRVYLVWGGLWGVRLKPDGAETGWDLNDSQQRGEPYLMLAEPRDIRFADEQPKEV